MFERFRTDAREATVLAQDQARELGHRHIGTEHLLLGLLAHGEGAAARALREGGCDPTRLRDSVGRLVATKPPPRRRLFGKGNIGHVPFTRRAKKALELSLRVALSRKQNSIGGGHVLIGVLDTPEATATRVLTDSGVDVDALRTTADRLTAETER